MERLPQVEEKGNAHESKGGVVVHREHGGHLSVSILPHPDSLGVARWDLYMVDNWHVDLVLRGNSLATGLLPLLAMFREPDLVADYLPRQAGLPYIESLQFEKVFADNDWLYHCFVTPFGPLPGADDVHGLTAFDLLDEPEGGLMMYAESPAEGVAVHRGWDVPKVNHWRRKRNYVLGSTVFFRPSTDLRPLSTPLPPANVARAGPCRSPNCPYFASSVLSNGACTYCCAKCAERPGKHGALCQKHPIAGGAPPPEWELPLHGTVDFELFLHMKIPIPTFLIPLSFARWVMVKLVRLVYPYLLTLNERFHQTPFSARVQEDAHGFYRRCAAAFAERSRPCNAERCNAVGGNEGEATGGCGGGSGGSTTGAGATQWAGPFVFNVPAS